MLNTIITAIVAFAATNIDDLFIDTVFFAQADTKSKTKAVILGKYLGIGFITIASGLCAVAVQSISQRYLAQLGLFPIAIGANMLFNNKNSTQKQHNINSGKSLLLTVVLVTVLSGGDNVGVYIPLFASFNTTQLVVTAAVFALLIGVWCFVAKSFSDMPVLKNILLKYKHIVVPIVLILLGLSILF